MNLREEFNRMDHEALDNDSKFYDLRSLVEAVNLTPNDKKKLQDYINKNDAKGANDYLQGLLSGKPLNQVATAPATTLQTTQQNLANATESLNEENDWDLPDEEVAKCEWCEEDTPIDELVKTNIGWICPYCTAELDSRGEDYIVYRNVNYYDDMNEDFTAQKLKPDEIEAEKAMNNPKFIPGEGEPFADMKQQAHKAFEDSIKEDLDYDFRSYEVYDFDNNIVDIFNDENEAIDFAEKNDLAYVDFSNPETANFERVWTSEKADEDILEEGRHDLVPVKCIPIKSNKPYYSPYDKKERTFAKYGTRFRYDTRDGCVDAIRDPEKDLGYLPNGEPAFNESLTLDEALFDEAQDIQMIDFNGTPVQANGINPEVMQMLGSPTFKDGNPKMEAWILIKLYEATIVNGAPYVRREELLDQVGTALSDRGGQSSTFFNNFTKLGLVRLDRGDVYPGPNLQDWVEGKARLTLPNGKEYAGGQDLRIFVNKPNLAKKAEQGANPKKSHRGKMHKQVEKPEPKVPNFAETDVVQSFNDEGSNSVDLSFFGEAVDEKKLNNTNKLRKFEEERANKVKAAYREVKHLDENAEITDADYDDFAFRDMCCRKGWNFDISKKDLLGRN